MGVHNGFMFQLAAMAIANANKTDFELVQRGHLGASRTIL